jgi:hypothetical protein
MDPQVGSTRDLGVRQIRLHVVRFMIFYIIYFEDRFGQILLWLIATLVQHERTEKINTIF